MSNYIPITIIGDAPATGRRWLATAPWAGMGWVVAADTYNAALEAAEATRSVYISRLEEAIREAREYSIEVAPDSVALGVL